MGYILLGALLAHLITSQTIPITSLITDFPTIGQTTQIIECHRVAIRFAKAYGRKEFGYRGSWNISIRQANHWYRIRPTHFPSDQLQATPEEV